MGIIKINGGFVPSTLLNPQPSGQLPSTQFNLNLETPKKRRINTVKPLIGGGNLSTDLTLSMPQATVSQDGYVSKEDWTSFNVAGTALDDFIANANLPDGPLVLSADSTVTAIFIHRTGTVAEIDAIVLEDGEIAITTDTITLRIGDGVTAGGTILTVGLDSTSTISLSSLGTPAQNGVALVAAYTLAAALTPNNSAKTTTNRARLALFPGVYTLQAQLSLENFVDIIGFGHQPTIETKDTDTAHVRWSAKDVVLKNLRFTSSTNTFMMRLDIPFGFKALCEDLFFDCLAETFAVNTIPIASGNMVGTFRRCTTNGTDLFGSDSTNGWTVDSTTLFEDCEGGDHSFGGAEFAGKDNHLATIRRCRMNGDFWNVKFGGTMEYCDWGSGIVGGTGGEEPLINGATFYYCRLAPLSGVVFENHGGDPNIKVSHCLLTSSAFKAGITNDIVTAFNVEDDDV